MKTNKILHIYECHFNLPNDFNGTLGEALMLMANRALAAEAYDEFSFVGRYEDIDIDMREHLLNNENAKCSIAYEIEDYDSE